MLKSIGTYNSLWMLTVTEAHRQAKQRQERLQVKVNGTFPVILKAVPREQ